MGYGDSEVEARKAHKNEKDPGRGGRTQCKLTICTSPMLSCAAMPLVRLRDHPHSTTAQLAPARPTDILWPVPEWYPEEAVITSSLSHPPPHSPGFSLCLDPCFRKTYFPSHPPHLNWMVHFIPGSAIPKKLTHLKNYRDEHK